MWSRYCDEPTCEFEALVAACGSIKPTEHQACRLCGSSPNSPNKFPQNSLKAKLSKLSQTLSKFLVLYLGCLTTSTGSLGLLNSTKKVVNFCNLVEGRRLSKCANQVGSSSPLLVHLLYLSSCFPFHLLCSIAFLIHFCKSLP